MFTYEHETLIIERSKSMHALCLVGGAIMTLSSAALLGFAHFLRVTSQESKPPLRRCKYPPLNLGLNDKRTMGCFASKGVF